MPLFDYVNENDPKDIIERLFSFNEEIPTHITHKNNTYRKLAPLTQEPKFRGSGFHATDYKGI